jgi:serine/threonine protein kinase
MMVMKLPQKKADQVKAKKRLKWEKLILSNLRGATSSYLPKYYHTIQDHFPCKSGLLADFILGYTLHDKLSLHRDSISLFFILSTGMHIANALIFLDGYKIAHLDLTPANIMIDFENIIKLIDFGESYEESVFQRNESSNDYYQYSPGISFPYSSPEALLRAKDFGFEQDIFSLGIILFQMFFGTTPLRCSQN